ncbi:hypothetical protein DCOP10_10759 [Armatimonadetes bacterium DC]|nr:hypothetical protein DCOP10_10759 [Armatimonadetes bacterium DC]
MNETLLAILIGLMVLNLVVLSGAVAALAIALRKQLPEIRQRVDTVQQRVLTLLDETIPALQGTHKALDEATRALHEAAETIENLHIVTDNIRHKLEVADQIAAKVRRLPEKTARLLGRLIHHTFQLGGRVVARQIDRLSPKPVRPSVYQPISAEPTAETTPTEVVEHTPTQGGMTDAKP